MLSITACGGSAAPDAVEIPTTSTATEQSQVDIDHSAGHCAAAPEFASHSLATHTATDSGDWSDTATWGGNVPEQDAIVVIPEGLTVSLTQQLDTRLSLVRIDGTLTFSPNQDTRLLVDTLYSSCSGTLQIGTADTPIEASTKAEVIFIDEGPVNDSSLLSRGAILAGKTIIYGAKKLIEQSYHHKPSKVIKP